MLVSILLVHRAPHDKELPDPTRPSAEVEDPWCSAQRIAGGREPAPWSLAGGLTPSLTLS